MLTLSTFPASDTVRLASPNGRIQVSVWYDGNMKYDVLHDGIPRLSTSEISMVCREGNLRKALGNIRSVTRTSIDEQIEVPIPEKRRIIENRCNEMALRCSNGYTVRFRAYDDGVAYRIETRFRDSVLVVGETARFNLPAMSRAFFPEISKRPDTDIFHTAFEENYRCVRIDSLSEEAVGYLPVLTLPPQGARVAIVESDLESYPGMFLRSGGGCCLEGLFAGYPLEQRQTEGEYPDVVVTRRADYIAGSRVREPSRGASSYWPMRTGNFRAMTLFTGWRLRRGLETRRGFTESRAPTNGFRTSICSTFPSRLESTRHPTSIILILPPVSDSAISCWTPAGAK